MISDQVDFYHQIYIFDRMYHPSIVLKWLLEKLKPRKIWVILYIFKIYIRHCLKM